ncbi:hypothetical protein MKX01_030753 [Papaver californicum]|nr:hypothetical protein MKX01_030753 [Papaver californicum]
MAASNLNPSSCSMITTLSHSQGKKYLNWFNGLRCDQNSFGSSNANTSIFSTIRLSNSRKGDSRVRAAVVHLRHWHMIPTTDDFSVYKDGPDWDTPTSGFASVDEAIEDIRQRKMVIVVDDEDRENEGDLIMAAELATAEAMAFIVKHGTGIVCVSMQGEYLDRLQLPLMVQTKENEEILRTAFTVTVVYRLNRPGYIFPLRYREGGVLRRAGHTEASVDLAVLAGFDPVAVLCEIVDEDGSMARLPKLREFSQRENLKIISIADLIRYRRKSDKPVERFSVVRIPTRWGPLDAYCYKSMLDGIEHIAMVKGDIGDGENILVRVHSECFTGDIFGSAAGKGVLVYLRGHEGRGIGLDLKLRAYNLQDDGRDTVEANEELGLPVDSREYGIGAQILRDVGVQSMKLMTNNPTKYVGLKSYGLSVVGRVPLLTPITKDNHRYLETKLKRMRHVDADEQAIVYLETKDPSVVI